MNYDCSRFQKGLQELKLDLSEEQIQQFLTFYEYLMEKNKVMNLTGITEFQEVVEKHFTLDKTLKGNDHYHAMDENDAQNILQGIKFIDTLLGNAELKCLETELIARQNARRSIVAAIDIPEGTKITEEMLTFKRPGTGISPSEISNVIGKKAQKYINADSLLNYNDFI